MDAARHEPFAAPVEVAPYPTAELAQAYIAQPNATRAWLFLRGTRPFMSPRQGAAGASADLRRYLGALDRAPRLSSANPHLPALGRWQAAKIAHERRFGATMTRHGAARRRIERARPPLPDAPSASIRPESLVVKLGGPGGATPWRGRYNLVVIDGEVLLYPRKVDAVAFRFRAYAGRETGEAGPVAPDERPIDAALRRLAAALQAHLDAQGRGSAG